MSLSLVTERKLSPLQAEGVTLAIHRFNRIFVSKGSGRGDGCMRAGTLLYLLCDMLLCGLLYCFYIII